MSARQPSIGRLRAIDAEAPRCAVGPAAVVAVRVTLDAVHGRFTPAGYPRSLVRRRALSFSCLVAVLGASLGGAGSASAAPGVKVWFLKGEQMTTVTRPGSTAQEAVAALLAGPTAAETKAGVETYVPQAHRCAA